MRLLAGVALESDRRDAAVAVEQELAELFELAVRQCIHGVDDNRLDPLATALTQHPIDDRHDVGQRLARPGTGGEHVGGAGGSDLDRIALVAVQGEGAGTGIAEANLASKDPRIFGSQQACGHEVIDRAAGGETRIQTQPRVGPLCTVCGEVRYDLSDSHVTGVDETLGERLVVAD